MEKLCEIKKALIDMVYDHVHELNKIPTCELGEVIDMIKDIEEAIYYKTVVKSMKEREEEETPMAAREDIRHL